VARTICGLFLFLLIATPGLSQTFRGGINGVLTDQSGATVPGAEIRATNDATGLSYSTASSNAGEFSFQDLPLGKINVLQGIIKQIVKGFLDHDILRYQPSTE